MQAKEEKYQRCIEKAKSVIITLDPKQDPNAEVAELRNQIQEKERIIVNMEVIIVFLSLVEKASSPSQLFKGSQYFWPFLAKADVLIFVLLCTNLIVLDKYLLSFLLISLI